MRTFRIYSLNFVYIIAAVTVVIILLTIVIIFFKGIYEYSKMWTYPAIFTLGKFELSFAPVSLLNIYIISYRVKTESEDTVVL